MNDQGFLRDFEAAAIPADQWMHRDHVRIAYLYLRQLPFGEALARLRSGIKALNVANGGVTSETSGYHETITHAWAQLIAAALARPPSWPDFESFAKANPDVLRKERLREHYTKERFMAQEARARFVEPDRAPLRSGEHVRVSPRELNR